MLRGILVMACVLVPPAAIASSLFAQAPAAAPVPPEPSYPRFSPSARILTGIERHNAHPTAAQLGDDSRQPFFLDQARLELGIESNAWLDVELSAELTGKPALRDAFMNVELHRAFQVRAGQFKRPISRTELTSRGKLPFRNRGLCSRLILGDANWGGRALGVMLWGKLRSTNLQWQAAAMNSAPSVDVNALDQIRGVDFLGRVEYAPSEFFEFGINGGHKITEPYVNGPNLNLWAIGGDARLRSGGLRVVVESTAAQNPSPPAPPPAKGRTPFAVGVLGYATYDVPINDTTALQPTVLGEWLDTDMGFSQDSTVRGVLGFNFLIWDSALRLMPQVEIIRPLGEVSIRSQVKQESYYLLLSAEI